MPIVTASLNLSDSAKDNFIITLLAFLHYKFGDEIIINKQEITMPLKLIILEEDSEHLMFKFTDAVNDPKISNKVQ